MSTWWGWLLGAATAVGALLLGVALVSAITLGRELTEASPPVAAAPRALAPTWAPAGPPRPSEPLPPGLAALAATVETPAQARLLAPPASGTWEATPIAGRARALGRAGVDLEQELLELRAPLSACFTSEGQSRHLGRPVAQVAAPAIDDTGSTVVVLQVEAQRGELRILGAPVEVRSGATDATLACVQDTLHDVRVASAATPPGPRFRLRFTVAP